MKLTVKQGTAMAHMIPHLHAVHLLTHCAIFLGRKYNCFVVLGVRNTKSEPCLLNCYVNVHISTAYKKHVTVWFLVMQ